MCLGIEITGNQARDQATVSGTNFVRASRKPVSDNADDRCVYARQRFRELNPVSFAEAATLRDRLILPGNAKQIRRIHVPQTDVFQSL